MKKILVIEDEEPLRTNIVQILELENFVTIEANNGFLGIELAQKHLPDLILCDVMMPEIDGYGVIAALRQNLTTASIPFIFTTAKASKADFRQGMNLGADDYLIKPITADELLSAISTRFERQATLSQSCISELKQAEEQLHHLIHYDSLTNLPNQFLLREQLNQLIIQADYEDRLIPIFIVQLDRLDQINNVLGHLAGDLLLKAVAQRLVICLGKNQTVARLQAKQFAILLETVKQKQEIVNVAQDIIQSLSQSFILKNQEVFITANIGIAIYPFDSKDPITLLKSANIAVNFARKQTSNGYQFYNKAIDKRCANTLLLDTDLHYALERNELQLYYQPQVELQTGTIVGAEALLRWYHPDKGIISPLDFIPIAEKNGLIIPITEWVLMTACKQNKTWQTAGFPPLRVAVNLSGHYFSQPDFSKRLFSIIKQVNLQPKYLELELTESIFIKDAESVNLILKEMQSLGVQIAIDDFGTGYSSLNYLKKFSFNTLKIDRCFVTGIVNDAQAAALTTAIIQMARSMSLKTVAEGVETEAELSFLRQQRCDEIQGYLFSRPLPVIEFTKLLARGTLLSSSITLDE
ncbi:EAL domain-containing response regulator [Chlorogloea sp. CCALA 695]|uniref:EAL domain-containing response regulator n=1 Tax=Chlorogloea sp. CCALA 695 TaxID=2107693 RepID=UPI000D05A6F3|nr:EAL domain-containing response regulator [Chlorogloea sp. CCALA 695]PSB34805.1 GGDEF domain-containing response regulator [Chlorogloea sp. CCALA 695]